MVTFFYALYFLNWLEISQLKPQVKIPFLKNTFHDLFHLRQQLA